jgi:DNA-directed RNA polymerase specialized sigma24 family protein
MANVLPVQTQQAILALQAQGRSIRRIARELGIHRKTVRGYLDGTLPKVYHPFDLRLRAEVLDGFGLRQVRPKVAL